MQDKAIDCCIIYKCGVVNRVEETVEKESGLYSAKLLRTVNLRAGISRAELL